MANIYEHQIYVPYPDDPSRVGKLETPVLTSQPILQLTDPFFRGTAMFHCAVCNNWLRNRCAAADPNECICLEINIANHVKEHGGEPYKDMIRASFTSAKPHVRDYLLENVPGLDQIVHGEVDWDISELTKDGPSDT